MFLLSLNVCFMILGEKEFKKPILDELGQNRTNIENLGDFSKIDKLDL